MELSRLRDSLRSGSLYGERTEYRFVELPRNDAGEWVLDERHIRGECLEGEIFEVPVTLDAGRWLAAVYDGPNKQRVCAYGVSGLVKMVTPCHKPGLLDNAGNVLKEPTPADDHCYTVEVVRCQPSSTT